MLKGAKSFQAVADCLIARNIPTARGGQWSPTAVMRVMQRLDLQLTKAASAHARLYEEIPAFFRDKPISRYFKIVPYGSLRAS